MYKIVIYKNGAHRVVTDLADMARAKPDADVDIVVSCTGEVDQTHVKRVVDMHNAEKAQELKIVEAELKQARRESGFPKRIAHALGRILFWLVRAFWWTVRLPWKIVSLVLFTLFCIIVFMLGFMVMFDWSFDDCRGLQLGGVCPAISSKQEAAQLPKGKLTGPHGEMTIFITEGTATPESTEMLETAAHATTVETIEPEVPSNVEPDGATRGATTSPVLGAYTMDADPDTQVVPVTDEARSFYDSVSPLRNATTTVAPQQAAFKDVPFDNAPTSLKLAYDGAGHDCPGFSDALKRKLTARKDRAEDGVRYLTEAYKTNNWAARFGSPADLERWIHQLVVVQAIESTFQYNAKSRAGAVGVCQFMPDTAKWMKLEHIGESGDERYDHEKCSHAMVRYFETYAVPKWPDSPFMQITAYNAGANGAKGFSRNEEAACYTKRFNDYAPFMAELLGWKQ